MVRLAHCGLTKKIHGGVEHSSGVLGMHGRPIGLKVNHLDWPRYVHFGTLAMNLNSGYLRATRCSDIGRY